jgi:hypothetical protein
MNGDFTALVEARLEMGGIVDMALVGRGGREEDLAISGCGARQTASR